MLAHDLLHASREISLEVSVVLDAVGAHEGLDSRIGIPLLTVDLITADMKIRVGEKLGHLFD